MISCCPRLDGWQVCREIRKFSDKPIIMLTAKGETFDKVLGLELGADDYVVKPFDAKEVVARVKAVLRRSAGAPAADIKQVEYDKLKINLTNYELWVDGKRIDTPPKELELIYHLASNPNRVFTRDQLLDEVWGLRLLRRFENGRCPCQEAQREARGRVRQVGAQDRLGRGL